MCLFVCVLLKELNMWIWRHNGLTIILWPNCPDWRDLGSHWPPVDGSLDISDPPQTFCRASNRRLIGWNGTVAAVLFSFLIKIIPNVMMVMVMLWDHAGNKAGHLKMKMCSWSAPSSSSSTTIRVSFFFCEKIDIDLDLGTFSAYLEIQPDNFGPKEKSDLLVTLVHKDSWKNGMADYFMILMMKIIIILAINLMRGKMTRNTCRCEAKRVFGAIFPKNDMSLHSVHWQLPLEIKIVMLESLISHCQSRPQWPL